MLHGDKSWEEAPRMGVVQCFLVMPNEARPQEKAMLSNELRDSFFFLPNLGYCIG